MNVDTNKLKAQLTSEEGRKGKYYVDTRGIPSIGIGRNLRDVGLSDSEIDFLYQNDVAKIVGQLQANLPWVFDLDEVRLRVVYDLCFNMGITKLLTFTHMLAALKSGDYVMATAELKNSLWDSQVGARAAKLEFMMKTGQDV